MNTKQIISAVVMTVLFISACAIPAHAADSASSWRNNVQRYSKNERGTGGSSSFGRGGFSVGRGNYGYGNGSGRVEYRDKEQTLRIRANTPVGPIDYGIRTAKGSVDRKSTEPVRDPRDEADRRALETENGRLRKQAEADRTRADREREARIQDRIENEREVADIQLSQLEAEAARLRRENERLKQQQQQASAPVVIYRGQPEPRAAVAPATKPTPKSAPKAAKATPKATPKPAPPVVEEEEPTGPIPGSMSLPKEDDD